MNADRSNDLTELLVQAHAGGAAATERLLRAVYQELREMAERHLRHESPDHTLQPTALVHEAYLKLVGTEGRGWNGRSHFLSAAAQAMRRILVDHARARRALKRGGDAGRLDGSAILGLPAERADVDLVVLDEAMNRLASVDLLAAKVVEMRFFSGMSDPEIARTLGTSERTVRRRWRYARAWLFRALDASDATREHPERAE